MADYEFNKYCEQYKVPQELREDLKCWIYADVGTGPVQVKASVRFFMTCYANIKQFILAEQSPLDDRAKNALAFHKATYDALAETMENKFRGLWAAKLTEKYLLGEPVNLPDENK